METGEAVPLQPLPEHGTPGLRAAPALHLPPGLRAAPALHLPLLRPRPLLPRPLLLAALGR